jgi:hypothetical protein
MYEGKTELLQDAIPRVKAMEKERIELGTQEPRHKMASSAGLDGVHELDAPVHDQSMLD